MFKHILYFTTDPAEAQQYYIFRPAPGSAASWATSLENKGVSQSFGTRDSMEKLGVWKFLLHEFCFKHCFLVTTFAKKRFRSFWEVPPVRFQKSLFYNAPRSVLPSRSKKKEVGVIYEKVSNSFPLPYSASQKSWPLKCSYGKMKRFILILYTA